MPYSDLPPQSFWKACLADGAFHLDAIYHPKVALTPDMAVATAGSCFAQNLAPYLRRSNLRFLDVETPPKLMPPEVARRYGFGQFSARTGNIYCARQLLQLVSDARDMRIRESAIWQDQGRFHDALRLQVEPDGFDSAEELIVHRHAHLHRLGQVIAKADVLIFTLGLTEAWVDAASGTVFSSAPGVVAGTYAPALHSFVNFTFAQVRDDLLQAFAAMRAINPAIRLILSVSPVPLSATATGGHVLAASSYSKSVLRAVAGELAQTHADIDYFPSYEMITAPVLATDRYEADGRHVTRSAVDKVMQVFFAAHPALTLSDKPDAADLDAQYLARRIATDCEEVMLDAFAEGRR